MHVILNPLGSHGDVHPFIALGKGLQARGHRITLVTSAAFGELAESHGFAFRPIGTIDDYHQLIENPNLWHPSRSLQTLFGGETYERMFRQTYFTIAELAQEPECVLAAGTLSMAARLAQEKLGIPFATVHLQPLAFFSVVDPPVTASMRIPSWWPIWFRRLLIWAARTRFINPLLRPPLNRLRTELGLPGIRDIFGEWRNSPQCVLGLFPSWYASAPDWPSQARLTGFLRYDQADTKPTPPALRDFLTAGDPPVIFSFGSAMRTGRAYFDAAVAACVQGGFRGVLLAKGGDQIPTNLPASVHHADYAPFSEVFPKAAVVVHHGGIGTTAQALTAGVPQLIMPMAFDQPDNAARLEKLGVARSVWPTQFSGPSVAAALRELLSNTSYRLASKDFANRMASEDPLRQSCNVIESLRTASPATSPAKP